jgi:hypothetical protein
MIKNYFVILLFLQLILSDLFAQNVLITEVSGNTSGYGPNEPSIMMDPNNTDILVAGTILNDFHRSSDGGRTWVSGQLSSSYGVWGDPVIDVDRDGHFYYFHLSNTANDGWLDRFILGQSRQRDNQDASEDQTCGVSEGSG